MTWTFTNQRALAQWELLEPHLDFAGKRVIDLGCGGGDLLYLALEAGADRVVGIEQDDHRARETRTKLLEVDAFRLTSGGIYYMDIVDILADETASTKYHIAFCNAVLPYLDKPLRQQTLKWLAKHINQSVIEIQYAGDGPGLAELQSDHDAHAYLRTYFSNVAWLGTTPVAGRQFPNGNPVTRTLWLCTGVGGHDE